MAGTGNKNSKLKQLGRIAVLAGGNSSEREISLMSGRAVCDALREAGGDALFLDITGHLEEDVRGTQMDVAFIALHGRFGEDGTIQAMLRDKRIPYTGSGPEASRLALDKISSRKRFEEAGIPVPRYVIAEKKFYGLSDLSFPVVVKPQFEGSSIGLSIVDEESELIPAMEKAFEYGPRLIIEEFVKGRELTAGILGEEVLPIIEIVPKEKCYNFFAKYESRDTQYLVPASIESSLYGEIQRLALLAHNTLGCRSFSRVDMILGDDGTIYVLEVNSIPGLTGRSLLPKAAQAADISFQDLSVRILQNVSK